MQSPLKINNKKTPINKRSNYVLKDTILFLYFSMISSISWLDNLTIFFASSDNFSAVPLPYFLSRYNPNFHCSPYLNTLQPAHCI